MYQCDLANRMHAVLKTVDPEKDPEFIQEFRDHIPLCSDCDEVSEQLHDELLTPLETAILNNLIEMNALTSSGCPDVVHLKSHMAIVTREHFVECDDCRENIEILQRTESRYLNNG